MRVLRSWLSLALLAAAAGCSAAAAPDNAAWRDGAAEDLNAIDASMDGPVPEDPPHDSLYRAAVGDVREGEEVMFYGGGLAVGIIRTHPGQRYDFGHPRAGILAMLANVHGQQLGSGAVACEAGRLDFADFRNIRVFFRDGRFVGWDLSAGNPQIRDEWSFSIGSPRADITDMGDDDLRLFESPRGVAFEADGVSGLLSSDRPDGVVVDLWSGRVCADR